MRKPPPSRDTAISSRTASACLRRQPSAPGHVGRGHLGRGCEDEPGQLAAGVALRRQRGRARSAGRGGRPRSRPSRAPGRRRRHSSATSARCRRSTARSTSFLAAPRTSRSAGAVSGPRSSTASQTRARALDRAAKVLRPARPPCERVQRGQRRAERCRSRRRPGACRRRPGGARQLVLQAPDDPHLLGPAEERAVGVANGPLRRAVAVHGLPERRQHDVGLRKEQRDPGPVDPFRRLGGCSDRATTLRLGSIGMPVVRPFSALRYDPAVAGPLDGLVAPPYDVIDVEARLGYLARSPYNIVHLTLPDSPERRPDGARGVAGRGRRSPRRPSRYWWVAQDYRGPDGVERTREGFAAAVEAVAVLGRPGAAARAHPRRAEGGPAAAAARDAHAARADLPALRRRAAARAAARRRRRWTSRRAACARASGRVDGGRAVARRAAPDRRRPPPLRDGGRLPGGASGGDAHPRDPRLLARAGARDLPDAPASCSTSATCPGVEVDAARTAASRSTAAAAPPRARPTTTSARGSSSRFSPRASPTRRTPTRRSRPSTAATPTAAFLLEPVTVDQVARFAERGETMPQKSTFFYPKLTSGLLLFPLGSSGVARAVPRGARRRRARAGATAGRAPSASRSSATARAATTRRRSTRRPSASIIERFARATT